MFAMIKSCVRSASAIGTGLALAGLAALPIQALAVEAGAAPAPAEGNSNLMVVRDAVTGQLRAATAEEARALQRPGAARLPGARLNTVPHMHTSGARGARLSDELMSYSVVVRQADGSLAEYCFASREDADAATKGLPVAKNTNNLPTE